MRRTLCTLITSTIAQHVLSVNQGRLTCFREVWFITELLGSTSHAVTNALHRNDTVWRSSLLLSEHVRKKWTSCFTSGFPTTLTTICIAVNTLNNWNFNYQIYLTCVVDWNIFWLRHIYIVLELSLIFYGCIDYGRHVSRAVSLLHWQLSVSQ